VVQTAMAHPEVLLAYKRINTGGMVNERGETYPVTITGIQPSVEQPISLIAENIVAGRFLQDEDEDTILISRALADDLGVGAGDRLALAGKRRDETMRQRTMTVAGIFNLGMGEAEKGLVFITLDEAGSLFNLRDQATEVTITLHAIGTEDQVISDLQANLPEHEVDSWLTLNPGLTETLAFAQTMVNIFGLILILIACIGILNLMLMAVFERTREMGVLAALGLKGRQVMGIFLLEGTLIGLVGAVVGCTLGWVLMLVYNASGGWDMTLYSDIGELYALMGNSLFADIDPLSILRQGITVAVMAALASLIPAWQASRKEPADSLHYV
jgi:ABC-type lipoprotein release transport system permease subunit